MVERGSTARKDENDSVCVRRLSGLCGCLNLHVSLSDGVFGEFVMIKEVWRLRLMADVTVFT